MRGRVRVPFDIPDSVLSLEQVTTLLDAMGAECEAAIGELVREFEDLAVRVGKVLHLAGLTAQSIDAVAVPAIPAKVQQLIERTDGFVRDRLEADSAVLDAVKGQQRLVEKLLDLNTGNGSAALEIRMLSVLTSMEVARLGESGSGFQYLVRELQSASETISSGAREFARRGRLRSRAMQDTRRRISASLPHKRNRFRAVEDQLRRVLGDVRLSVEELSACPAQLRACAETVSSRISGVVSAVQSYDITRQQSEHVRDALSGIAARIGAGAGDAPAGELAMGLRVQVLQLENVKAAMESWTSQIDECLESICAVSQTRLERVAPMVLAQEEQLSGRLRQIESIEGECESDSLEAAEAFASLSTLVALVAEHARIAQMTRDRLEMLSFNSIIEARNLGAKADVMLEISKNVTRIASGWGVTAKQSAITRAELKQRMDETQATITIVREERDVALREARSAIAGALGDLRSAAQCAAGNAAEMARWTDGLHERIETARSISRSLSNITDRIERSIRQIDEMRQNLMGSAAEKECDPARLEEEYSRSYTTEIERHILRAALYGEAVPIGEQAETGNDVELF